MILLTVLATLALAAPADPAASDRPKVFVLAPTLLSSLLSTSTAKKRARRSARSFVGSMATLQTVNDSPQEQLFTSFGFFNTKPERIKLSCHSSTEPPRYSRLLGSTTIFWP